MRPCLEPDEIKEIAGGYTQPRRQLDALRAFGFWRARLGRDMQVILERAHYEAVCAGALPPTHSPEQNDRPKIQPIAK